MRPTSRSLPASVTQQVARGRRFKPLPRLSPSAIRGFAPLRGRGAGLTTGVPLPASTISFDFDVSGRDCICTATGRKPAFPGRCVPPSPCWGICRDVDVTPSNWGSSPSRGPLGPLCRPGGRRSLTYRPWRGMRGAVSLRFAQRCRPGGQRSRASKPSPVVTTRVQRKNPGAGWPRGLPCDSEESDYAVSGSQLTYFTVHLTKAFTARSSRGPRLLSAGREVRVHARPPTQRRR